MRQGSESLKTRGDVIIRGLWDRQTDAIINVKLGDSDTDTYKFEPMETLLDFWEKINKDKHGKHCHDKWKHFLYSLFLLVAC